MASVVDQSRQRVALERIESTNEHFMVAGTSWIDAQETLTSLSRRATICVDVALATAGANANWLKTCNSFDRGFGRPQSQILKPRANHLVAFLDPTLIWNRSGMGMRCGRTNFLNRDASRLTDHGTNLIGTLIR